MSPQQQNSLCSSRQLNGQLDTHGIAYEMESEHCTLHGHPVKRTHCLTLSPPEYNPLGLAAPRVVLFGAAAESAIQLRIDEAFCFPIGVQRQIGP